MKLAPKILVLALSFMTLTGAVTRTTENSWQSLNDAAVKARDQGRYADAVKFRTEALREAERFGEGDRRLGTALVNLAFAYMEVGKYSDCEPLLKRALAIYEQIDKGGADSATTLNYLGNVYMNQGKYAQAEPFFKKALADSQVAKLEPAIGRGFQSLGRLHIATGNFPEAQSLLTRALAIYDQVVAHEPDDKKKANYEDTVTDVLIDLGGVYTSQYKYALAQSTYERALSLLQKLHGTEHPQIATLLTNMGGLYSRQGQYASAEKLYGAAFAIFEKSGSSELLDAAACANNLAITYKAQNKFVEAQKWYQQALASYEKALGTEHPDVAKICQNLAQNYSDQDNYPEAERLLRRALSIRQKAFGANHRFTISVVNDLARLYQKQRNYPEAKLFLKRLLQADETTHGPNSPSVASDLSSLAAVSAALNKPEEARPLQQRAEAIQQGLPGASRLNSAALINAAAVNPSAVSAPVQDKWALVIGISNFKDDSINLKFAAKDAIDFRNYLVSSGQFQADHVKLLTDGSATRENIVGQLGDKWLGRRANKDDLVVVYVSSHGSTTSDQVGVNFLVAWDTNKNALVSTGIPMQWLSTMIKEQVHSDRVVLVMDVCHSGAASAGEKSLARANNFDIETLKLGQGQAILCSSLADQISWESKQYDNSVFTRKLIDALKHDGTLTPLSKAYGYLRSDVESEVLRDRGEMQTPVLNMKSWTGNDPVLSVTPTSPRPGLP